jgi:hypothetical protein
VANKIRKINFLLFGVLYRDRERDSRKAAANKTAVSGVKMTGMYSRVRNLIPDSELAVTDASMGMH